MGLLGAAALCTIPDVAFAEGEASDGPLTKSRVTSTSSGARGVTIKMELMNSPFPSPGSPYKDATVLAFVPHHYRASEDGTVSVVVHFHGYNGDVDRSVDKHQLREQFHESKQNAILLVPELAANAASSAAGKLEADGGFRRLLVDALATLNLASARKALGDARLPPRPQVGRVCVSAHSGGYHAAACAITQGGIGVQEVFLFDALYADVEKFKAWVIAGKGKPMKHRHKLVSYYTAGTTEANTVALFAELTKAGVKTVEETVEGTLSRAQITQAEAVSIKTSLGHGAVASELRSLRDCLFASTLPRQIRSSWFKSKDGSRQLDRSVNK
ncbi:hypothetical protein AKJ09_05698 [Labilithrix luteola]|uniref:Uncharacterized protein n=1 Tax=Labilithrix luteola TaxID=1391654 RepID=A0A0K1Q0U5_9BACT|nr:hypothetical protein [Labilithrix luteola]AKU99034.1 hypothetical protein AKJ09_05698 [Labilithrix luteola]